MPLKHKASSTAYAEAYAQTLSTSSIPKNIKDILRPSNLSSTQIAEIEALISQKDQEIKDKEDDCRAQCATSKYLADLHKMQYENEERVSQRLREQIERLEQQLRDTTN